MNKDEKIRYIYDLLKKNIERVTSVTTSTETGKSVFCILVNGMSTSLIIEDRFMDTNSKEEIEKFFNECNVYSEIVHNKTKIQCIREDITLWPNDENCQRLNRH